MSCNSTSFDDAFEIERSMPRKYMLVTIVVLPFLISVSTRGKSDSDDIRFSVSWKKSYINALVVQLFSSRAVIIVVLA